MSNFIKFSKLTKAQYQGLTPDPSTLYLITDNNQICFGDSLKTADSSAITDIVHYVVDPSVGTPGGFATLNAEGKVPAAQVPSLDNKLNVTYFPINSSTAIENEIYQYLGDSSIVDGQYWEKGSYYKIAGFGQDVSYISEVEENEIPVLTDKIIVGCDFF